MGKMRESFLAGREGEAHLRKLVDSQRDALYEKDKRIEHLQKQYDQLKLKDYNFEQFESKVALEMGKMEQKC